MRSFNRILLSTPNTEPNEDIQQSGYAKLPERFHHHRPKDNTHDKQWESIYVYRKRIVKKAITQENKRNLDKIEKRLRTIDYERSMLEKMARILRILTKT
ncbi:hypothetical protein A9Q99_22545 [Gammaproteobacteria bacterium 45_16_T64]|nr:hypothetical protein A9Q99_22545 [Gammaproteobacteria bacterium 45_16_T64]